MNTRKLFSYSLAVTLLFLFGCSQCSSENVEEDSTQQTETESGGAENSISEAMKNVQDAVNQLQEGESVEVVDFRKLKDLLPEKIAGMKRVSHTGEKAGAMGFKISQANAVYRDGDQELEFNIVDAGGMSLLISSFAMWSTLDIDRESDDEYERSFNFNGQKAFEKYNFKTKRGEFNTIAAERFVVSIKGKNVPEKIMKKAREELDYGDFRKLK